MSEATWLTRAKETHKFHFLKKRDYPKWTIQKTATALNRSLGGVSEDLLIAAWYRTHKDRIEKFDYAKDCLEWIRQKDYELQMDGIE